MVMRSSAGTIISSPQKQSTAEDQIRSNSEIRAHPLRILEHALEHHGLVLVSRLDVEHKDLRPSDQQISPIEGMDRDVCERRNMSADIHISMIAGRTGLPMPMLFFFFVTLKAQASEPSTVTSW